MFSNDHYFAPRAQLGSARSDGAMPVWKRIIDIACCLLLLPFLAIGTLLVAVSMWITAPGPIFFRQERVGCRGRRFFIYKFRTMCPGAESWAHRSHFAELVRSKSAMQKMDTRDERLIPGGWLVRATGLDELPQIINVLRGEMSMIGPRPCIPYEVEQYNRGQRKRFEAVPGLSGLWQVSGKNRTTFDQMVQFDITYVETMNFRMDMKIILLTFPALCRQVYETSTARRAPAPVRPFDDVDGRQASSLSRPRHSELTATEETG